MNPTQIMFRRRARMGGPRSAVGGFTLIELMIAMLLGLVVIAGVISVFLAVQRSYATNKALGDVQDSARTAFELMSRDIREAGVLGCGSNGRVANIITDPSTRWFTDLTHAFQGYGPTATDPAVGFGTTAGLRSLAAASDSLEIIGAAGPGFTINQTLSATSFKVNEATPALHANDIIAICDEDHTTILQVSSFANRTVTHNFGKSSGSVGNCSKGLGYPSVCTITGNAYTYGPNASVSLLESKAWFVGVNPLGGTSLYRVSLDHEDTGLPLPPQELIRNVTQMTLLYHLKGGTSFVSASSVSDWGIVDSVRMTLTLESSDQSSGTNAKAISRTFTATTTMRNRVQ